MKSLFSVTFRHVAPLLSERYTSADLMRASKIGRVYASRSPSRGGRPGS